MNRKKTVIKIIIFILITLLTGGPMLTKDQSLILKVMRMVNSGLLAYMLVDIFSNIKNQSINRKKLSKKMAIIMILWGVTSIIVNTLQYGTILKLLNVLAIGVIGSMLYELFIKKTANSTKIDMIKFGYIWVGFVLLIPVVLILVLIGH